MTWEPFTPQARRAIVCAQEEAIRAGHNYIGTEHMILGLISGGSVIEESLVTRGLDLEHGRRALERLGVSSEGASKPDQMVFTPRAKQAIENCFKVARGLKLNYLHTDVLLLALIETGGCGFMMLSEMGAKPEQLGHKMRAELELPEKPAPPPPAEPEPEPEPAWLSPFPVGLRR